MASIVASLLSSYLRVFLKDYTREQLDLSLGLGSGAGEAVLRDIRIDERVVHRLARLPPSLQVASAGAATLAISIPWARLGTEPVRVALTGLTLRLAELAPDAARAAAAAAAEPLPALDALLARLRSDKARQQQQPQQQKPEDQKERRAHRILEDMEVSVDGLDVEAAFLDEARAGAGPCVTLRLDALALRTTDAQYRPQPLPVLHAARVRDGTATVYKALTLGAAVLGVRRGAAPAQELVRLQPLAVHAELQRRAGMSAYRSISVVATLPKIAVCWTPESWQNTVDAINAFLWCAAEKATASATTTATTSATTTTTTAPEGVDGLTQEELAELDKIDGPLEDEDEDEDEEAAAAAATATAAAFASATLPVVKFHVALDVVDVTYPGVARLLVNQASARIVIDHLPVAPGADLDEWRKHKQLSFQFCVVEVGCQSLVPGQERLRILGMDSGPFLDGNISVRPSLRVPHRGCGRLSLADGYATVGALSFVLTPQFLGALDRVVASCVPRREVPAHELRAVAAEHVHALQGSAAGDAARHRARAVLEHLWWLDNVELSLVSHGIAVGLAHFVDADNVRTATAAVKRVELSLARHPHLVAAFTNTLLEGTCSQAHTTVEESLTAAEYEDPDYLVIEGKESGRSEDGQEQQKQQQQPGGHLLRAAVQVSDCSLFVADEHLGKEKTKTTHFIVHPVSATVHATLYKPVNFIASFFSEGAQAEGERGDTTPSFTASVHLTQARLCIDQQCCAMLVDIVMECWNSFGKKWANYVPRAARKVKALKEKETEKHQERIEAMKEHGKELAKSKTKSAQNRVSPFRVGAMVEWEGVELKLEGDTHVIERVKEALERTTDYGVQHLVRIVLDAVRNTSSSSSAAGDSLACCGLVAPVTQTLGVASIERLFATLLFSDKVGSSGASGVLDATVGKVSLWTTPLALVPFSVEIKERPRRVLEEEVHTEMLHVHAEGCAGCDTAPSSSSSSSSSSPRLKATVGVHGWEVRTAGDMSEVGRTGKALAKAGSDVVRHTAHKDQLKRLGSEVGEALKKAASTTKDQLAGGAVDTLVRHLDVLDKLSVTLSLSNSLVEHSTVPHAKGAAPSTQPQAPPDTLMDTLTLTESDSESAAAAEPPSTATVLLNATASSLWLARAQAQHAGARAAAELRHRKALAAEHAALRQAIAECATLERAAVQAKVDAATLQAAAEERRQALGAAQRRLAQHGAAQRRLDDEARRLHALLEPRLGRDVVAQTRAVEASLEAQVLAHAAQLDAVQRECARLRAEAAERAAAHRAELARFAAQREQRAAELRAHISELEGCLEALGGDEDDDAAGPHAQGDDQDAERALQAAQREQRQQAGMHATYVALVDSAPELVVVPEPVFLIATTGTAATATATTATTAAHARPVPARPAPTAPPTHAASPKHVRPSKPPPPPPAAGAGGAGARREQRP